jgi:DNA-binding beta-propeller fold protein YncE
MINLLSRIVTKRIIIQVALVILIFVFATPQFSYIIQAQDTRPVQDSTKNQISTIKWVKQYPPIAGQSAGKSTKAKIVDFVLGKNQKIVLSKPVAVLASNPDNFWILDQGNGVLFKIENELGEIPHFRHNKLKNFSSLVGISIFIQGKLLFTDSFLNKVFLFDPEKKELVTFNDTLNLNQPTGIAFSPLTSKTWVVETKAHQIAILNENGQLIKRIGSRGTGPGEFNYPTSIWIDKTGKAFIVDAMNFRVQIFSKDGDFISMFGKIGDATGYFARPKGIATDSFGNIYIVDALFNAVQIFDQAGNFLYTFGLQGREKGEFWMPSGIFIDDKDFIYVADCYNFRVQVFQRVNGGFE